MVGAAKAQLLLPPPPTREETQVGGPNNDKWVPLLAASSSHVALAPPLTNALMGAGDQLLGIWGSL